MFSVYVCQRGHLFGAFRETYFALWDSSWHSEWSAKIFRVLLTVAKISK